MPLGKKNAAKYFYQWVDLGTPVWILSEFTNPPVKPGDGQ
jgi:hypothetical protein